MKSRRFSSKFSVRFFLLDYSLLFLLRLSCRAFAEVRTVRLPRKMALGEETHRGFGFVDFFSEADARKAFEALCHSTHLYGRRLVLEWAAAEEGVEELRKRTAEHFAGDDSESKRSRKGVFDASGIEAVRDGDEDD